MKGKSTMRCFICNSVLDDDKVSYNPEHEDFDPCPTCQSVVDDVLAGFGDSPAPENDTGFDPILEGLFPRSYDPFGVEESS